MVARGFAPAAIQAETSYLILPNTEVKLDSLLLKILALRSFQMIHIISSARLQIAFCGVPNKVVVLDHDSNAVFAIFQFDGFRSGSWIHSTMLSQILLVKRQSASKCRAVSIVCLHMARAVLCGHPRLASLSSLSEDQTLF